MSSLTQTDIDNGVRDLSDLGHIVNDPPGSPDIVTREGQSVKSIPSVVASIHTVEETATASRDAAATSATLAADSAVASGTHAGEALAALTALQVASGEDVLGTLPLQAVSRAAMIAMTGTSNGTQVFLGETGYEGVFKFSSADHTVDVTTDPGQLNYIAPGSDPDGSSGAWVRVVVKTDAQVSALSAANILNRLAFLEDAVSAGAMPALTTAGAAYHGIFSPKKLVQTYSGPFGRGIREADSVAVDLPFVGNTVPPYAIAALHGAGKGTRIDRVYNQLGTGAGLSSDMTQVDATMRPALHEDAYIDGAPVILIDGNSNFINGAGNVACGLDATFDLHGQAYTLFVVTDFKASHQYQGLFAFNGSSGPEGGRFFYHDNDVLRMYTAGGSDSAWATKHFHAGPTVYAIREKAGPTDLIVNGQFRPTGELGYPAVTPADFASPAATPLDEVLSAFRIGYNANPALQVYNSNMRLLAVVAVKGTLNDVDTLAITRALQVSFGIASTYKYRYIKLGDSIGEGGANKLTLESMWYLLRSGVRPLGNFFNFSRSGDTLANAYTYRIYYAGQAYIPSVPVIYGIQLGINDLRGGTTPAALYATLTNEIAFLKGQGLNVRVIAFTIQKAAINDAGQAAAVEAYNALVRANTAGADVVYDVAAEPHLARVGGEADVTLLGDGLHNTSLLYSYEAPNEAAAVNQALALLAA